MPTDPAPMHRARLLRPVQRGARGLGGLLFLAFALAVGCSTQKDTEAFVPAERGAIQPDAGGALVSEAEACQSLKNAEGSARQTLSCPTLLRSCPDYIRPAGGADCFKYDQGSIDGCVALYASFASCEDFAQHPCLISAVSKCDSIGAGGASGEGGAGGAPSSDPVAGNAGAAGDGVTGVAGGGGA